MYIHVCHVQHCNCVHHTQSQPAQYFGPMLIQCRSTVYDIGPTLDQHRATYCACCAGTGKYYRISLSHSTTLQLFQLLLHDHLKYVSTCCVAVFLDTCLCRFIYKYNQKIIGLVDKIILCIYCHVCFQLNLPK